MLSQLKAKPLQLPANRNKKSIKQDPRHMINHPEYTLSTALPF